MLSSQKLTATEFPPSQATFINQEDWTNKTEVCKRLGYNRCAAIRGTWIGWGSGQRAISLCSSVNVKFCSWGGTTSGTRAGWIHPVKSSSAGNPGGGDAGGCLGGWTEHEPAIHPGGTRGQQHPGLPYRNAVDRLREAIPTLLRLRKPYLEHCGQIWAFQYERLEYTGASAVERC